MENRIINGYKPGKSVSFLPSVEASWIEEFNKILQECGMSRNALTELLIKEAIIARRNGISSNIVESTINTNEIQNIDAKLNEILHAIKNIKAYTPEPNAQETNQPKTNAIDQPQQEDPQNILVSRLQAISPK